MKFHTRLTWPKVKRSVLTIPGTHGTWPARRDYSIGRTGAYYIRTKPTQQVSLFLIWGWTYYVSPTTGKKVRVS